MVCVPHCAPCCFLTVLYFGRDSFPHDRCYIVRKLLSNGQLARRTQNLAHSLACIRTPTLPSLPNQHSAQPWCPASGHDFSPPSTPLPHLVCTTPHTSITTRACCHATTTSYNHG